MTLCALRRGDFGLPVELDRRFFLGRLSNLRFRWSGFRFLG
jgi:hypothetical protein